ncbi:amidohydrolase family protein [Planctomycetaceae bacterium SH139]
MRIDSHHHFWNFDAKEYAWIDDSMSTLKRDFTMAALQPELTQSGVEGVISVQARQSVEETQWLLELAAQHKQIWGVVGWVPLAQNEDKLCPLLDRLSRQPLLKGVRHVIQDEPDERFMLRNDFSQGVALLQRYDLVYDILIYARQLPPAVALVDRHPNQRFVLDHIAKPTIEPPAFDTNWAENLRQLAKRPNVACKFSGVVTEIQATNWSVEQLQPYWDVALEAFGPERLMFGSDWPVCLLRSRYDQWVSTVEALAQTLSTTERARFWAGTAEHWYQLTPRV